MFFLIFGPSFCTIFCENTWKYTRKCVIHPNVELGLLQASMTRAILLHVAQMHYVATEFAVAYSNTKEIRTWAVAPNVSLIPIVL